METLQACGEVVHERRLELGAEARDHWDLLHAVAFLSAGGEVGNNRVLRVVLLRYADEQCIHKLLSRGEVLAASGGWKNTVDLCRLVFNGNGRKFLRALSLHGSAAQDWLTFWRESVQGRIKSFSKRALVPVEDIVLAGGAVLQALGVRAAVDFDLVVTAR